MVAILTVGPFDVALTLVGRRSDSDSTRVGRQLRRHSKVLRKMYVDVYWICFAMSLAGLPYAEEYDASGHVAALGKLLDSGRRMAVMWLAMGLGGLLFLGLVLGSGEVESADAFNVTLIACSNTANSLVLVLLLGVGAVELPKALWIAGDADRDLARCYTAAACEFANLKEASVACSNAAGDAIKTLEAVDKGRTRGEKGAGGDLSFFAAFFDVSLEACAAALREDCAALGADGFRSGAAGAAAINKRTGDTDADAVADCRRRLARARKPTRRRWAPSTRSRRARSTSRTSSRAATRGRSPELRRAADAERLALALPGKPILLKCAAVCAAVASACLLVSQIGAATANTSAALDCSAFAVMARSARAKERRLRARATRACCV
ncbi:LMBR1-like membrane protein [Aureococcus anophagefferens]|uniref:LMBR1-like membrane protein n=1 Tax=Aureococcus anophagefferens TaxID=44056 RepID=A0ABR1FTC8_AURAN